MANQWEGLRNLEAPGPDYFIPEVFTLEGGEVQGMETSTTDPKVRFDSTGVYVTSAGGLKEIFLSSAGMRLLASKGNPDGPTNTRSVAWRREFAAPNNQLVAQVSGGYYELGAGGPSYLDLFAFSPVFANIAQLVVQAFDNVDASTGIYVKTNTRVKKLIAEDGSSDFVVKVPTAGDQYVAGPLRGFTGGSGLSIGCRGGNTVSFDWTTGAQFQVWIDGTLVRNL